MQINTDRPDVIRVYIADDVVELADGAPAPDKRTAVWHLKRMDFDAAVSAPIGKAATEDLQDARWVRYMRSICKSYIVGWENIIDQHGRPVDFNAEYLIDGTIHPGIAMSLVLYLVGLAKTQARDQIEKKTRSATGPARKRTSGKRTRARRTAERAR